ncbi:MAG: RMD1 family protein, partial [Chlamydiia bacterium]|nr:RMD1 family protein [Chlamydiia bacterium]
FEVFSQGYETERCADVTHINLADAEATRDAFFFPYGVAVFWNVEPEVEQGLLAMAQGYGDGQANLREEDEFPFSYGSTAAISKREIILPGDSTLNKLAASHAIAQSTKLCVFEKTIFQLIRNTEPIPLEMASTGRQPLRAKGLRKMMGQLYIDLSSVNLHIDLLDEPEFFWDYEEVEPIYAMTSHYLDIEDRVHVLNRRLEVVRDLFEMLSDEIKHKQSSRLELTIIWLIVIEVLITLGKDVFAWI